LLSPVWEGVFYVENPQQESWELHLEFMNHEPSTEIFLNGHHLGYLPVKDWVYAWVSARFTVPPTMLRPGYNVLAIRPGYAAPSSQDSLSRLDEVQFRDVYLERATTDLLLPPN